MDISAFTSKVWEQLLQNTPNQDPRLLIGILSILGITLVLMTYFILSSKKQTPTSEQNKAGKKQPPQSQATTPAASEPQHWVEKLKGGLSKTRNALNDNLSSLFGSKKLDDDLLEEIHEKLFRADLGIDTADTLVDHIRSEFGNAETPSWDDVKLSLKSKVSSIFSGNQSPINEPTEGPMVILVVGVNGVGKTTSIGKLAANFALNDKKVLLCAADTYRAAAIDQLQVWGDRLGIDVIKHQQGADPASVAYDGVKAAMARKSDVLLIDTAGRLHNKAELMDELAKIRRVIGKDLPSAPHETWIVVDATTGQNAFQQVEAFSQVAPLSGIVVTKLDGTAKGGVVIGVSNKFKLPIRYIGVGEQASDLKEFKSSDFADSIF